MCDYERCPACESTNTPEECVQGVSGDLVHLRCRYCGFWWASSTLDLQEAFGSSPGDHLLDTYA